jgi:2-aminoethylphosphonate-pyruvate transaminase
MRGFAMLLLLPGPVTTRPEVRAAMAQDLAPWDDDFRTFLLRLRARVLRAAKGEPGVHTALPLQGCGHFITEAAIRSLMAPGQRILIPDTGAYAQRMARLAREAGRDPVLLAMDATRRVDPGMIAEALARDPTVSHVGAVYSETGSGVAHDVPAIGAVVRAAERRMLVDAVSAFGALPLDLAEHPEIDAVVFTTNKCLEALPGIGFAVARIDRLEALAGQAGSWSFDLADVYARGDGGSFRFTPPAQVLAALDRALDFWEEEGQPARLARYRANTGVFYDGMVGLGLTPYLAPADQGPVIVNTLAPDDPAWDLRRFVDALKRRGFLISNFHTTPNPTFRVGCIGAITPRDMGNAVDAMDAVLRELGIKQRKGVQA